MAFVRRKRDIPRVDLTPMVDVVFLLLIFFMISTTFVETPGITIELPEGGAQVVQKEPEEIRVYLNRQGEIHLHEQKVTLAELRLRLQEHAGQAQKTTFVLMADREARHGTVVELMDLARATGFGKLAIATREAGRRP